MATLAQTALTLADQAKRTDPDGNIATVVELLEETNEILDDMLWLEANDRKGHLTTIRTGLPKGYWRYLNRGVPRERSTTAQITDVMGMLETYSVPDKALYDMSPNPAQFRASEDKGFLQGLNHTMAGTIFYGNVDVHPARFTGLAPRYSDLNAGNGEMIIDHGGTGSNNTSIWAVSWGDTTCHGIFPQGSTAGLQHRDLGEDTVTDSDGNEYQAMRTHFKWDAGVTLRDWGYVGRIANIDTAAVTDPANSKALITSMIRLSERLKTERTGRTAFYVNRTIRENLRLGILEKIATNLTWETVEGRRVMMFDDIPVRRCDQLLNTEARVVGL